MPVDVNSNMMDAPQKVMSSTMGLSEEEYNDPNQIHVEIPDKKTPIIVLFGPASCGKTMTLVRMTRYLQSQGYTVQPESSFRPSADTHYQEICKNFNPLINSNEAAKSTSYISFMLVRVLKNGKPICQILEAPGEYYFTPQDPQRSFPVYVNTIISSPNRKVWCIFIEPDGNAGMDSSDRANYVNKMRMLKNNMAPSDNVMFIFNKVDKAPEYIRMQGNVDLQGIIERVEQWYPSIYAPFINVNPITRYFKKYNCDLIPFQTGFYNEHSTGNTYTEGPVVYADKLWKALLKQIRG